MKIYRTNQESINKGIIKNLNLMNYKHVEKLSKESKWFGFSDGKEWISIKVDNRIKGYCLLEVK